MTVWIELTVENNKASMRAGNSDSRAGAEQGDEMKWVQLIVKGKQALTSLAMRLMPSCSQTRTIKRG